MCSQSAPWAIMRRHSAVRLERSLARTEGEMIAFAIVWLRMGSWGQVKR
jgi:hypothetical protein